jgi:hypothetical protein
MLGNPALSQDICFNKKSMTHQNFQKKIKDSELNSFLLSELNIVKTEIIFIEIDIDPDYDVTDYEKGIGKNYYFKNKWNFKHEYNSIIEAEIIASYPILLETIHDIKSQHNITINCSNSEIYSEVLRKAYLVDKDCFNGKPLENWDDFKVNTININEINNIKKEITYDGGFFGELPYIKFADFEVVSKIRVKGFKKNFEFYNQLIAESKILLTEDKYKLSYFLLYSAIENYINNKLNSENLEERLEDKLKRLCKINLGDLNKNKIYSSIVTNFKKYTAIRNTIAHGKEEIEITKTHLFEFSNFVLLIIYINKTKINNFEDILKKYTTTNIRFAEFEF